MNEMKNANDNDNDEDKENKRESVDSEQNSSNMQEELVIQAHNLKKAMMVIEHLASA